MRLNDVTSANGRIFLKSEWAPVGDRWPALSFTKRAVGDRLRRDFNPATDILLYVGTASSESTPDPQHQQRLLSALKVEPNAIIETRLLVPAESWHRAQREYPNRWEWSLVVRHAWEIVGFPVAPKLIPQSYSLLGRLENLGNIVELVSGERQGVLALEITPVELHLRPEATAFDDKRNILSDERLRKEVGRIATGLIDRARRSGTEFIKVQPVRVVESDIHLLVNRKWQEQHGLCALCGGELIIGGDNRLLQGSADRIDSSINRYDDSNVHITHLGCNLAKNDVSMEQFAEWLRMVTAGEAAKATSSV